jgi:hypothetical protein
MSMSMIEQLQNADSLTQGWFVAGSGLVGVFLVLVLFFFSIKLLQKIGK